MMSISLSVILAQSAIEQDMVSGAHLMLPQKTIEKLGYLFDETFFYTTKILISTSEYENLGLVLP